MSSEGWEWNGEGGRQQQYRLNSSVLLTAIFCLVFVVVLVVVLHFYARHLLRRQHMRRVAGINSLRSRQDQNQHNAGAARPRLGLDAAEIAAIPAFSYKKPDGPGLAAEECAVCLSAVEEREEVRVLPNCKHVFHVGCIDMWLHSHSTCPVCRAGAAPKVVEVVVVQEDEREAVSAPSRATDGESSCSGGAAECDQEPREGSLTARLGSSFRRMMSRERSERRVQVQGNNDGTEDLERQ